MDNAYDAAKLSTLYQSAVATHLAAYIKAWALPTREAQVAACVEADRVYALQLRFAQTASGHS